ncbi:YhfX family PLP-dependent enzyme [Oceanotoga sp. DSM 15011]|jgi:predicted amino acid racemase|uniref:Amino acid racemase n=1 Tax=Oceanotoga teriensis TaxID=515440 RepID=A0AA45C6F8_9BACT|nr:MULTISPECIES: YhfX family PLP-dependent enzyme [Oceanotoga]MDN5342650.1 hypothetical protein [Oceanotoga sp.]MDO7975974.1 YhfX family PLP-dependent enzyme [Oceanotoga teriensis]PWJ92012.1 putative amino acid racemase [Oceanotoga teriensis]UYO99036.1 YhfX family PLP-dependent enzyme [Oceanotoga sp. DSM 15011]
MFLEKTMKRNPKLIQTAFELHQNGLIPPDTYIIDLDTLLKNAKSIKDEADKYGVKLFFMTKQLGRNPYIADQLLKIGYEGAVVVDFEEAEILAANNIKIGNIGHLVQTPNSMIKYFLEKDPEIMTVYSIEKAQKINDEAQNLGKTQKIMLRVLNDGDMLYPAQYGGFYLNELEEAIKKIQKMENIKIYGITSFPCFLYNEQKKDILPTPNIQTIKKAIKILNENGINPGHINMPSATCTHTIKKIKENGGTHGEPGHGLLGTTPMHADFDMKEIPSMVYVSEISHNLKNSSFMYGGGHYRRSHMENVLVGKNIENSKIEKTIMPDAESIDYYIEIDQNNAIGDTTILNFRTQIFVTRSKVAVVKGIQEGKAEIIGLYDSQGRLLRR